MHPLLFIWRAIRTYLFSKFQADCRCFPSTWSARLLRPRALSPIPIAPITMAATVGSRWRHQLRLRTAQEVGLLTCLLFYTRLITIRMLSFISGASANIEALLSFLVQVRTLIFAKEHPDLQPIHYFLPDTAPP